ncbi:MULTISPECIES: hypothetical protein [unclassified Mesorhizobium]|uniref:hypothetical protein n=1 Tax=unclassified Mesorhizobium TaxID=325217 RepID=UPI0015E469C9|nr:MULTISPECIES: hypothetical protein [unclassified Mesorhizobium]
MAIIDRTRHLFLVCSNSAWELEVAIQYQAAPRYKTRNEEIIAELRLTAGAAPSLDPRTVIKRKAAEIATAMALVHGGDWRVEIDHQVGFVLVAPRVQPQKF